MNLTYWLSVDLTRALADILFRPEIIGLENLPQRGPLVMAVNHCSHLDPPLLGCHLPLVVNFFARETLWKPGFASWWLTTVGTIPVDRDGADIVAMKRTIGAVEAGGVVILFPEGTRSPDGLIQSAKAGVGMIACRTQVPVVPVRILGTFAAFGRNAKIPRPHPVTIVIGRPLPPAAYDDPAAGRSRYQIASDRIMSAVAALQPPVYPAV
jgi:1-acyl-sn-glycerol-3-phosphate acyltransferase